MKTDRKIIPGLRLERKLGEIISVNRGELLIQVVETGPKRVKLAFYSEDKSKYVFARAEIAHKYEKPEGGYEN